jgi:hypothetical protein
MRKVLFEDVAELGVRAVPADRWLRFEEGAADPKIEWGAPDGVEGWAMIAKSPILRSC